MRCESCGADAAADDAEIARLKALITELADVLDAYGFNGICEPDPQKYDTETYLLNLIQRAREATK